jgi:hypothetical protein
MDMVWVGFRQIIIRSQKKGKQGIAPSSKPHLKPGGELTPPTLIHRRVGRHRPTVEGVCYASPARRGEYSH